VARRVAPLRCTAEIMKRSIFMPFTASCWLALACGQGAADGTAQPSGAPTSSGSSLSAAQGFIEEEQAPLDGSGCNSAVKTQSSCVSWTLASESLPLDLYIMFDQSGSMCSCTDPDAAAICPNPDCNETRIDAIRRATEQFLIDPASAGIGVGLGRFGERPIGEASCDAATHATPSVPLGLLPDHASTIVQALNRLQPTGETPTGAALRGACSYARDSRAAAPDRRVVLLLVTDGQAGGASELPGGHLLPIASRRGGGRRGMPQL
jgi:hypothetical protein